MNVCAVIYMLYFISLAVQRETQDCKKNEQGQVACKQLTGAQGRVKYTSVTALNKSAPERIYITIT